MPIAAERLCRLALTSQMGAPCPPRPYPFGWRLSPRSHIHIIGPVVRKLRGHFYDAPSGRQSYDNVPPSCTTAARHVSKIAQSFLYIRHTLSSAAGLEVSPLLRREKFYAHVQRKSFGHITRRPRRGMACGSDRPGHRLRNLRRSHHRDCGCIHRQLASSSIRNPPRHRNRVRNYQRDAGRNSAAPHYANVEIAKRMAWKLGRKLATSLVI